MTKRRLGESSTTETLGSGNTHTPVNTMCPNTCRSKSCRSSAPSHRFGSDFDILQRGPIHEQYSNSRPIGRTVYNNHNNSSSIGTRDRMTRDRISTPRIRHRGLNEPSTSVLKLAPTIVALAISILISGTSATTIPSSTIETTTKFPHTKQGLSMTLNRKHRSLQQALQQCKVALGVVDRDRDDTLDQEEYLRFVNQLASKSLEEKDNKYTALSSFDELPQSLKDNYEYFVEVDSGKIDISGAKPGQATTSEKDLKINELCEFTRNLIIDPTGDTSIVEDDPSPVDDESSSVVPAVGIDCNLTIERGQCNVDLSISDSYQNDLLSETDYVRFVNRLSDNFYANYVFDEFPNNIRDNFVKFAIKEGQVDILGSKPGQRVSIEQDKFLEAFCCETDWAVQNPGVTITEAPAQQPDGLVTSPPTFDLFFCQRSMASSDLQRNNMLNEDGYVIFLNRLTSNGFVGQSYDDLDPGLQSNFENLAVDDGQINIYGSKPGQTPNEEEENNLINICVETGNALNGQTPPNATPTPTVPIPDETPTTEPSVQQSLPPTFDKNTCWIAMAPSDANDDDYLNAEEFAAFVVRLTGTAYEGLAFDDLPSPFTEVYENLVSLKNESEIYIFGSKPDDTPDEDQESFLQRVCLDVAVAYSQTEGWTIPPVSEPSGSSTFAPGLSTAYNSFIISNRGGLTAADLAEGTMSRDGLNQAYGLFVERAIDDSDILIGSVASSESIGMRRSLRRRKLKVDLSLNSDEIYLIEDSDCPEGLPSGSKCQTAFARFDLTVGTEDPKIVSKVFTNYTQTLISERILEIILKEVDPRTILKIVDASYPVTPKVDEITQPPTVSPTERKEEEPKKNNRAGPIVGGLFGTILICAIIGYVYVKGLPFELPSFLNRGRDRIGNKRDQDDEDEHGLGFGRDDDDASVGDKNSFGNGFGMNNNTFGDDDDEEEEQKDRNRFGFTKKKKKEDEEDVRFGLDSPRDASTAFGAANNMYAFEEPSEVDSQTENQDDQGSVGESEDIVFGGASETTPNWGIDTNVFAGEESSKSGWGANGGEEGNFFGAPAFGDDEEEEDESESGSESSYSSEDDTYESGDGTDDHSGEESGSYDMDEADQEDSYSGSSADYSSGHSKSVSGRRMSSELKIKNQDMNAAIDNEDWDAVVDAAKSLEKSDQDSSMAGSSKKMGFEDDEDFEDDDSYSDSYSGSGASATSATTTSEDLQKRAEYRAQVEELVRVVLPDETEKVDAMMDQFKGREAELVSTLQTMEERTANQRARAAVHKSKPPSNQQNAAYSMGGVNGGGIQGGEGSTAGTAAIAAASLPIPAEDMFEDEDQNGGFDDGFGQQNAFGEEDQYENEGSEYSDEYDDRSYYSGEEGSGSRSYYSGEEPTDSRSFYSDEGSHSRSYDSGGEDGSRSRSYYSQEEGSQPRSYYSQEEGSQSRSYNSQEGSQPRSYYSQEEGSQSRSYYSQEGSASRSYYSQEGSRSYYSGEGSSYSGDDPREGSVYSEDGSHYSEQ